LKEIVVEELRSLGKARESFEVSMAATFGEELRADALGYLTEAERHGVDRMVLEVSPPFDRDALASLGKTIYG
jgi:hypothetical protein